MSTIILLYPSGHDFDMDYYLSKHMTLLDESWSAVGLQSWEVLQFPKDSPYQVQCILQWESEAAYDAAIAGPAAKAVVGDVRNYTTTAPIKLRGTRKATSAESRKND